MAMACRRGGSECTGCGRCQPEPKTVGECAACGDLIYSWEDRYNVEGEIIHYECLHDWAEKYKEAT